MIATTWVASLTALLVAGRVVWELVYLLNRQTPELAPDFDTLGPDAGLWPGLFGRRAS